MPSILNPGGTLDEVEVEADVIVTSVILGFSLTRAVQGEPFSYDVDPLAHRPLDKQHEFGEDMAKTEKAVGSIKRVLTGVRGIQNLAAGVSDVHGGYGNSALITGRSGGSQLGVGRTGGRSRDMESPSAIGMRMWENMSASKHGKEVSPDFEEGAEQYHGRGAYTGMIDDPIGGHTLIQPTLRRVITDHNRWSPDRGTIWGLIDMKNQPGIGGGNLDNDPKKGMGPLRERSGIVQYVHGMSWAMREALRWGPWCNAYEMAVGDQTKKLSSCFPCTTYMYAAGFPPSSCHIGRGESWGILPDGRQTGSHVFSDESEGEIEKALASSINVRWHSQVYHYMRQGCDRLLKMSSMMGPAHKVKANALNSRLDRIRGTEILSGGNLFLDALTFHKGDCDRVNSTLGV